MENDHIVEALTGDSGWRDMLPQAESSDFPKQWMPSALECSIIDAQAKEIEKLRAQLPRWIPVTERLPEYGVRVLATDMYEGDDYTGIRTREEYPDDADGCWYDERGRWYPIDDATHWMPLPKTPEVKRNE